MSALTRKLTADDAYWKGTLTRQSVIDSANTVLIDEVSATLTYIGSAKPGATTTNAVLEASPIWQIIEIDTSANPTTIRFANGRAQFQNIWNDRAGLTYKD